MNLQILQKDVELEDLHFAIPGATIKMHSSKPEIIDLLNLILETAKIVNRNTRELEILKGRVLQEKEKDIPIIKEKVECDHVIKYADSGVLYDSKYCAECGQQL